MFLSWAQRRVDKPRYFSQYKKSRCFASCTIHATPSCTFAPVMALHVMIFHVCVLIASSPRNSNISAISTPRDMWTYLFDLVFVHAAANVTFVLEHKQTCTHQALTKQSALNRSARDSGTRLLLQQSCQFKLAVTYTCSICCIDDPYQSIRLFKVILPICP